MAYRGGGPNDYEGHDLQDLPPGSGNGSRVSFHHAPSDFFQTYSSTNTMANMYVAHSITCLLRTKVLMMLANPSSATLMPAALPPTNTISVHKNHQPVRSRPIA